MDDGLFGVLVIIGITVLVYLLSRAIHPYEHLPTFSQILKTPGKYYKDGLWDEVVSVVIMEEAYIRACELDSPNAAYFGSLIEQQEDLYWDVLEKARKALAVS